MWSDNETSEDLLGFKVHADLLIDVIEDDGILPVTVGVFGDWGSGKSSILKILYENLRAEKVGELKNNTLVLYFNGWVFEGYDDAKAALLESIIEQFDKHKKIGSLIKDETKKLFKSVKWMRVMGLGFKKIVLPATTAYFTGGTSLIPFLARELSSLKPEEIAKKISDGKVEDYLKGLVKESPEDETKLVREFREDFKSMIDKSKISKLVVIIDDLDRCTHERIIENLEAIKLFLNVDKTAFVIGADPRIVRHAIEYRYRTAERGLGGDPENKNQRIVSDYLEKLIQIPYTLPRLSDHEVETYMTLLFAKRELATSYIKVHQAFGEFRKNNRYGVFGFADIEPLIDGDEKKKLSASISLIAALSSIIAQGLNGNPRQIKRFLNTFTLRHRLATVANIPDFRIDVLAKLMVLEYTFPELFAQLHEWQALQKGEPIEITSLEGMAAKEDMSGAKDIFNNFWKDPQMLRWLNLEPKFSGFDLSDYFWLSRDQLFSSVSGSSLIPTHIRSLFKLLIEPGSGTILKTTVATDVIPLPAAVQLQLFSLLEKELIKNPEKPAIHKIYIEMMGQKIPNSITSYKKVVGQIGDHDSIPFSLRSDIQLAAKSNPEVQELDKIFQTNSQIYKALNQKK